MKIVKKISSRAKYAQMGIGDYLLKLDSPRSRNFVFAAFLLAAGLLIFVDSKLIVEKIGVSVSIVIAGIALWIKFDLYKYDVKKVRNRQMKKKLIFITNELIDHAKRNKKRNIKLIYSGKKGNIRSDYNEIFYFVEWKFKYRESSDSYEFGIYVRRMNENATAYSSKYVYIVECNYEFGVWSAGTFCYKIADETEEVAEESVIEISSISRSVWDVFLLSIYDISVDKSWRSK